MKALIFLLLTLPAFSQTVLVNDCSGSLVRFETSKSSDKAMVLTSGKCFEGGLMGANEYIEDIESSVEMKLLNAEMKEIATLKASRLIYASVSISNLALYELTQTFDEISLSPYTISKTAPEKDLPIQIISSKRKLTQSCEINMFPALLVEGDWTFLDSIYYSTYPTPGCHTRPGMEGSPVIEEGTGNLVAVDNTRNMATNIRCRQDNACEVDLVARIIIYGYQMSYGQQTHILYNCLDEQNKLNLALKGCELPPNRKADPSPYSRD